MYRYQDHELSLSKRIISGLLVILHIFMSVMIITCAQKYFLFCSFHNPILMYVIGSYMFITAIILLISGFLDEYYFTVAKIVGIMDLLLFAAMTFALVAIKHKIVLK